MAIKTIADVLPDFTGELLRDGRYELEHLLGAGACGVVYRAVDLHAPTSSKGTPMPRAVKIVQKAGPLNSDTWYQRQEIALHQLVSDHPHVLTLHDTWEDERFFYFVMDCHESDMYRQLCADESAFQGNDERVRSVFVQVLDAVHACHERKVFHRDLKPENILCNADGNEVFLADFGLATPQPLSQLCGCGSSFYMSPECIGEEFEQRAYSTRHADIWALGVIFVNMLTGLNPWERAVTADSAFSDFLVDDDYFERVLLVSRGAIQILKDMFAISPKARPSIPQLRERILKLPTFFPPKQAEAASAYKSQHPAVEFQIAMPKAGAPFAAKQDREEAIFSPTPVVEDEEDIGTVDLFEYGLDDGCAPPLANSPFSSAPISLSTSSSGSESYGPLTPGECMCPTVDVDGFAEGLGKALRPLASQAGNSKPHASPAVHVLERLEILVLE